MTSMDEAQAYQAIKNKLGDRRWRLNNLYYIQDKEGRKVIFRMNWAQRKLYDDLWYFNVILKARQLGFTTFAMIYFLDSCLFNSNQAAGVIAHTMGDAQDLFDNKAKFAYDNLPEWLKAVRPVDTDRANKLAFNNGSSLTVGTSLRSGTYQKLLISEFGKVSAKFPEKAREIKTGALNTVTSGQQIIVESTAEGRSGEFFDLCETARKLGDEGRRLTPLDPKFHFFPWHANPEYALSDDDAVLVPIRQELRDYLRGLRINPQQMAWYAAKEAIMEDDMKREYPSTPEEAFEGSLEGAWYHRQMADLRRAGRIRKVPYDPSHSVYTFWDLGLNDQMSIWFTQLINGELYFIDYHESSNEGWNYYARLLQNKGYTYERHIWPHDGTTRIQSGEVTSSLQEAGKVGIRPITIVPRTTSVEADIRNYCRPTLPMCYFDAENCADGLLHLDNYRRKWDKAAGMFGNEHLHDEASHGADAFRTGAVAFKTGRLAARAVSVVNKAQGLRSTQRFENSLQRNKSRIR